MKNLKKIELNMMTNKCGLAQQSCQDYNTELLYSPLPEIILNMMNKFNLGILAFDYRLRLLSELENDLKNVNFGFKGEMVTQAESV